MLFDRYIEAAVFRAFGLVAAALSALFSLLEFVDQLSFVGQGHYRLIDALVYVLLTVPSRLLQVTPVSMLLGCLLALGTLARNSELTALRSLGISEGRIVGSVLKLVVPIVVVLFLMAEFVIPPAQQLAQTQRLSALSTSAPSLSDAGGFWAQGDGQYLNVGQFDEGGVPKDIEIYAFAEDGSLQSFIHADRADIRPDGTWLLSDVLRKRIYLSQFQTEHLASLAWHSFMPRQQTELLMLPPESMPPVALYRYVRALERRHQQAERYEQELWTKASIPVALAAMVMIAGLFAFGSLRAQSTGHQIAFGVILGVVLSLGQQIASYLALLLDLNPAVATLAPPLLLLMVLVAWFFHRARG